MELKEKEEGGPSWMEGYQHRPVGLSGRLSTPVGPSEND